MRYCSVWISDDQCGEREGEDLQTLDIRESLYLSVSLSHTPLSLSRQPISLSRPPLSRMPPSCAIAGRCTLLQLGLSVALSLSSFLSLCADILPHASPDALDLLRQCLNAALFFLLNVSFCLNFFTDMFPHASPDALDLLRQCLKLCLDFWDVSNFPQFGSQTCPHTHHPTKSITIRRNRFAAAMPQLCFYYFF